MQPDAGGLVIAIDVEHARSIAELLERRWRVRPTVATSDDPMASARIGRYAASADEWIVAVRMVSEGVDIPRLRVGVFATNTTTELFFRQALGRLVRWTRGMRTQRAWMYIPDDPRLRRLADGIAEARRHSLYKRPRDDDFDPEPDAEFDALDGEDEQLSLFQAMSSMVTGIEGADDPDAAGAGHDDADAPEELVWNDDDGAAFEVPLPPKPRRAGLPAADGAVAVAPAPSRTELRGRNADLVAHLVAVTGRSHREINGELNRMSGVSKVTEATVRQLEQRLAAGEALLRAL